MTAVPSFRYGIWLLMSSEGRVISAKYEGRCFKCLGHIAVNERCIWYAQVGICHIDCEVRKLQKLDTWL